MEFIARAELSSASSITFSSIPQGYDDIVIKFSGSVEGSPFLGLAVNGGTSFNSYILDADGTNVGGSSRTDNYIGAIANNTTTVNGTVDFYFGNYSASSVAKTVLIDNTTSLTGSSAYMSMLAVNVASAPITSIEIRYWPSGNLGTGSLATIYGISRA